MKQIQVQTDTTLVHLCSVIYEYLQHHGSHGRGLVVIDVDPEHNRLDVFVNDPDLPLGHPVAFLNILRIDEC